MTDSQNGLSSQPKSSEEILVVASKLKNYIRVKSGMNTSSSVLEAISSQIRRLCDEAIEQAKKAGRKTVMDRDFQVSS